MDPCPSPSTSCLISFCGRISMIGSRSRPFHPRKDAFLRLRGDVITIHKDEEHSQLLMPPLSIDNMVLVKRKDTVFKMYFTLDSSETIVRMKMEERIAEAFSFLLHESWRNRLGSGRSRCEEEEEWNALARGYTRKINNESWKREEGEGEEEKMQWRKTWMAISERRLLLLYEDGIKEEDIDLRKVISCCSNFDRLNCCEEAMKEKEREERQIVYSISLNIAHTQVIMMDSGEMKVVSTLRSMISHSISIPQTSLGTCRISKNDVPIVIEETIRFLNTDKRLSTRGIYRVSSKNITKNKLVEQMIHSPCTVFSLLNELGCESNGRDCVNGEYAKDEVTIVYMVCDGLRSFLRRMDSPLIPDVLHIPLFDAMCECSLGCRLEKVQSVIHSRRLPSIHRNTLSLILNHLREVAKRSDHNGMTTDNLARILAPCLFSSESSFEVVEDITPRVSSTLFLIENYHVLFI
ncbi:hypothetical protein PENTCL1PPCAC_11508 [Pristionchus entomophagus]|uniref:Rho-GAP domain-containing protein n=1 Tax=Pristionchus entomophagus TaxID=358040 RepID=A0AAV5T568_9BILA|nr:hypothetical protein PENTCL1PPCAC_11508 [Pristionchus entomophagus]